jgi:inhibitor of cysteine peptidase
LNGSLRWALAGVGLALVVLAAIALIPTWRVSEKATTYMSAGNESNVVLLLASGLPSFRSWDDIWKVVRTLGPSNALAYVRGGYLLPELTYTQASVKSLSLEASSQYYSETNVQVAGVDEADIVKTDGRFIYVLSRADVLKAYKAYPPESLSLSWSLNVCDYIRSSNVSPTVTIGYGGTSVVVNGTLRSCMPIGLYLVKGKVMVITVGYYDMYLFGYRYYFPRTWVLEVDNGSVVGSYWVDGNYVDSRLSVDGRVVIITSRPASAPAIMTSQGALSPNDVYLAGEPQSFTIVSVLNPSNLKAKVIALLGSRANLAYMTYKRLYIVHDSWYYRVITLAISRSSSSVTLDLKRLTAKGSSINVRESFIEVIDLSSLKPLGTLKLEGIISKSWQLNEIKDMLVVVADLAGKEMAVNLYIFNVTSLSEISSLKNISVNERVKGIRLLGSRLYVVTYRRVDPLFVIDISNPLRPRILGFMKALGFDEYLHPINGSLIVGVGTDGRRLRISLYKVTKNYTLRVLDRTYLGNIGDFSWSPVLNPRGGHKAFTYDPKHGYILMPAALHKVSSGKEEGLLVVKVNNSSLKIEKLLAGSCVQRGLYIDDVIYAVSICGKDTRVTAYNATTLEILAMSG